LATLLAGLVRKALPGLVLNATFEEPERTSWK
jgi:hypothetical protein